MKYRILIAIAISTIILLSGCTNNIDFPVGQKLYCSPIGECDVEEKNVEIPDIITIKEVKVLPIVGNRVRPNSEVDILVTLENRDSEKPITIKDIRINPGIFNCSCSGCKCEYSKPRINPGQIKTFDFKVKAPDIEGTLAISATLEVSVKYSYESVRKASITFIKEKTFKEYIEGGKKIPVSIINVPSDGPVELYLDISKIYQPVILDPKKSYQIYLEVRNKGSGEIDKIDIGNLILKLQNMILEDCSDEFGGEDCKGESEVSNTKKIVLRGNIPKKYYFSFNSSSDLEIPQGQLTVTKTITAKASYIYRISKSIELIVSPRAEI
jgi:hypothetical protein